MLRALVICTFVFAVGGALGFQLGTWQTKAKAREDAVRPPLPQLPPEDAKKDAAVTEEVKPPAPPAAPVAVRSPMSITLQELMESAPLPANDQGDGEITIRAIDINGLPVKDLRFSVTMEERSEERRIPESHIPQDDFEAVMRESVAQWIWNRKRSHYGETDDSGLLVFKGLPSRGYYWQSTDPLVAILSNPPSLLFPGTTAEIVVQRLHAIPLEIIQGDGVIPWAASVVVRSGSENESWLQWVSTVGTVNLRPGTSFLRVTSGSYEEWSSDFVEVNIPEQPPFPKLKVELSIKRTLILKLIPPPDWLTWSFRIRAWRADQGTPEQLRQSIPIPVAPFFETNGMRREEVAIVDVQPNSILIAVSTDNGTILAAQTISVTDGITRADIKIDPPAPSQVLVIKVSGPNDQIVRDAQLIYRGSYGATLQDDGSYILLKPALPPDAMDTDKLDVLIVNSARFGTKAELISRTLSGEHRVRLQEPATVIFSLRGFQGSEQQQAYSIHMMPDQGSAPWDSDNPKLDFSFDKGGQAIAGPIQPGAYRCKLSVNTADWQSQEIYSAVLNVASGRQESAITLPALYSLTLLFPTPGEHAATLVKDDGAISPISKTTGGTNSLKFEHLSAGSYRLTTHAGEETIRLQESMTLNISVHSNPAALGRGIRILLESDNGLLAQAGFRHQDLIVEVEGLGFRSLKDLEETFIEALRLDQTSVTVLRGKEVLKLEFRASDLLRSESGATWVLEGG